MRILICPTEGRSRVLPVCGGDAQRRFAHYGHHLRHQRAGPERLICPPSQRFFVHLPLPVRCFRQVSDITALAGQGHNSFLRLLLALGANPNAKDDLGNGALHKICQYSQDINAMRYSSEVDRTYSAW